MNNALSLKSVLHIPQFSSNLLSVSPLAKSHNCNVTFNHSYFVFQHLEISGGRELGALYFVEAPQLSLVALESLSTVEATLMWHRHLRHAHIKSLKCFFPHLSISNDVIEKINCDTCRFAKSCRNSYSAGHNDKSNAPFSLVHSEWRASLVFINGYRHFISFIDDATRGT